LKKPFRAKLLSKSNTIDSQSKSIMANDKDTAQETHAPMLQWRDIAKLIQADETPCVSIYVPTTPVSSHREEMRIAYKDQIKKIQAVLDEREMDKYERDALIEQLETVGTVEAFWTHQQYGLAVFVSGSRFMVRRMMTAPQEAMGIVADSFHLRPALRATSNWMQYQVLCVSLHGVALYDCNQNAMVEVDLNNDVPSDMGDALGRTEHGSNSKESDQAKNDSGDLKHYFTAVDRAINDHHNGRTTRPLVLAAVSEYQGLYREISENPNLVAEGVNQEPFEAIREGKLGDLSWAVAKKATEASINQLVERYNERSAHGEGEDDVAQIAYAATIGQVESLLLDETARIEGTVDDNGAVQYGEAGDTHTDDVLDAIAAHVIRADGDIHYLPASQMPGDGTAAAILRFAMEPA